MYPYSARLAVLALALGPALAAAAPPPGQLVWQENCEGCHGIGVAGAPVAGDPDAWAARIAQGRDTLYSHAIEGFFGPGGTMMPPRGGNDALTDEQVRDAVDYMVLLASPSTPDTPPSP